MWYGLCFCVVECVCVRVCVCVCVCEPSSYEAQRESPARPRPSRSISRVRIPRLFRVRGYPPANCHERVQLRALVSTTQARRAPPLASHWFGKLSARRPSTRGRPRPGGPPSCRIDGKRLLSQRGSRRHERHGQQRHVVARLNARMAPRSGTGARSDAARASSGAPPPMP